MSVTYWKVNQPQALKVYEWWCGWWSVVEKARDRAKQMGAESLYTNRGMLGDPYISGFQFTATPDRNVWKRLNCTLDGYCPKRLKVNQELCDFFDSCKSKICTNTMGLLSIRKTLSAEDGGFYIPRIGIAVASKTKVIITVDSSVEPKHCKRISDMAYEKVIESCKSANCYS